MTHESLELLVRFDSFDHFGTMCGLLDSGGDVRLLFAWMTGKRCDGMVEVQHADILPIYTLLRPFLLTKLLSSFHLSSTRICDCV